MMHPDCPIVELKRLPASQKSINRTSMPLETEDYSPESSPDTYQSFESKQAVAFVRSDDSLPSTGVEEKLAEPTKKEGSFARVVEIYWIKEFAEWFISVLFLGGLVGMLGHFENKSVPEWPHHITLNAAAAVFVVVIKAMLLKPISESLGQLKWEWFRRRNNLIDFQMFDAASRGPRGAIPLLWKTRGMHLSSLGALLVLITMVVDPFVQQLVVYPTRMVPSINSMTSLATVPRAQGYADWSDGFTQGVKTPSYTLRAAICNGIFNQVNKNENLQVNPVCTTGNCTFAAPYSSLAVCSKCWDVSDALSAPPDACADDKYASTGNLSLPNGLVLDGMYGYTNFTTGLTIIEPENAPGSGAAILADVSFISRPSPFSCTNATATQCQLYYCVNSYTGRVTGNQWIETLEKSWTPTDLPEMIQYPNGSFYNLTLQPPESIIPASSNGDPFYVFDVTWLALFVNFGTYLSGSVSGLSGTAVSSNDIAGAFYSANNVSGVMHNLAQSMTQALRQNPDTSMPYATTATGVGYVAQQYCEIRWAWLTLPLLLQLMTLVFILATIRLSRARGVPAWKSQALPVLRANLLRSKQAEQLQNAVMLWEMNDVGKHAVVQFDGSFDSASFKAASSDEHDETWV